MSEALGTLVLRQTEAALLLEATPGVLRSLLEHLPHAYVDFHEQPAAWSPRIVLLHLIHCEIVEWIPAAKVILSPSAQRDLEAFPSLPHPDEIPHMSVEGLLSQFAALRAESVATLRNLQLKTDDYNRTTQHPVLGTVTLAHLLAAWVVHDLNHIQQIVETIANRHVKAVGPWRQHLETLTR